MNSWITFDMSAGGRRRRLHRTRALSGSLRISSTNLTMGLTGRQADEDVVRDWMEHLVDGGMEASSVGTRFAALRSLFKFALARHLVERDPTYRLEPPKKAKRLPTFLKESEMNRLLDDLPWGTSFKDVRDKAIITTFYETGIRLSEAHRSQRCGH